MKTSELTGYALDRAVAKAVGMHVWPTQGGWFTFDSDAYSEYRNDYNDDKLQSFRPSTDWAQGGAIIEREWIGVVKPVNSLYWVATMLYQNDDDGRTQTSEEQGATPLEAAMRCYVASKLGDEVQLPRELK